MLTNHSIGMGALIGRTLPNLYSIAERHTKEVHVIGSVDVLHSLIQRGQFVNDSAPCRQKPGAFRNFALNSTCLP